MIEKFYIIRNEKFLKEVNDFKENEKKRNAFIKDFFKKNDISGTGYFIAGDGYVNCPFTLDNMDEIELYIDDCEKNIEVFGGQLLKSKNFNGSYLRRFRKGCSVLKSFQKQCVEENIVINNHLPYVGDLFSETRFGKYRKQMMEFDGNIYLRISTDNSNSLTPVVDGLDEIKGSEFYSVLEKLKGE